MVSDNAYGVVLSIPAYYNNCSEYLIMDYRGDIYTFPSSYITDGSIPSDKSWGYDNSLWKLCNKVNKNVRLDQTIVPHVNPNTDDDGSNIFKDADFVATKSFNIPGYKRVSPTTETKYTDAKGHNGWVKADPGGSANYRFYILFQRDTLDRFKTAVLSNINLCTQGSNVYKNEVCTQWCDSSIQKDTDVNKICEVGYVRNVLNTYNNEGTFKNINSTDRNVIAKNLNTTDTTLLNDKFSTWCAANSNEKNCSDVRNFSGTDPLVKKYLDSSLSKWCSLSDTNFNSSTCNDPKTECSKAGAFIDNVTIPNYNCYNLATSSNLSADNRQKLVTPVNLLTGITTNQRNLFYGRDFNRELFTKECSYDINKDNTQCKTVMQSDYKTLIKTSDTFPVLLMYFAGDINNSNNTILPLGLDASPNLDITWPRPFSGVTTTPSKITSIKDSTKSFLIPSTYTNWSAKLYTYIMPTKIDDYIFKINADDNVKMYINNTLIKSSWEGGYKANLITYPIRLEPNKGPYILYCEYKENGFDAKFNIVYSTTSVATYYPLSTLKRGDGPELLLQKFSPYDQLYDAKKKQSLDYCNKSRVDSNNFCFGIDKEYYNPAVLERCSDNMELQFCSDADDITINNYSDPNKYSLETRTARDLTNARLNYMKKKVSDSLKEIGDKKGLIGENAKKYLLNSYPKLQTNVGSSFYGDNNFVTPEVINFCELNDTDLKTEVCSTIYNKFSNNLEIKASKERMDDYKNCIVTNKFMTDPSSNDINNPSCSDKRDDPATFARYMPLAINYCGNKTGDVENIISPECQSYYNNIGENITRSMRVNYEAPVPGSKDAFTNKESFENIDSYMDNDMDNDSLFDNKLLILLLFIIFVLFTINIMKKINIGFNKKNSISPEINSSLTSEINK